MKLLIITAVEAFEENVKTILKESGVLSYSYNKVVGYRDSSLDSIGGNWFASELNKDESLLFFAFVTSGASEKVYENIEQYNKDCDLGSQIHIAISPIEKSNSIKL